MVQFSAATSARRPEAADEPRAPDRASAWTLPMLCAGIAIIACCIVIPAADENRRLVYEREKLKVDLEHINRQIGVNDEFLRRVADDPTLLERLAQRQMKMVREGTSILQLRGGGGGDISPFPLVTVPPPQPLGSYRPIGGKFSDLCRSPRTRLILIGTSLMLMASGLVLGYSPKPR